MLRDLHGLIAVPNMHFFSLPPEDCRLLLDDVVGTLGCILLVLLGYLLYMRRLKALRRLSGREKWIQEQAQHGRGEKDQEEPRD